MADQRRTRPYVVLLCVILSGALAPRSAAAVILHAWTFDELAAASDVILVVKHIDTRDTGRRTLLPRPGSRFRLSHPVEATELESELEVLLQLKGDAAPLPVGTRIFLRHFHSETKTLEGYPWELDFSTAEQPYYLGFLKRGGDGVFETASGDDMPADSLFTLRLVGGRPIQWEMYLPAPPPSASSSQ